MVDDDREVWLYAKTTGKEMLSVVYGGFKGRGWRIR